MVAPPDRVRDIQQAVRSTATAAHRVAVDVVAGGAQRSDSVAAGLAALRRDVGVVLVHDAARALTPPEVFETVVAAVRHGHAAVVPALPVTDTIKSVDDAGHVAHTPERARLRAVQTPQGFLRETLERAHAGEAGGATDDASLVEAIGGAVYVVDGHVRSAKVTTPGDLAVVGSWLAQEGNGRPVLLVLGGLPGAGKTSVARRWAQAHRAAHVRVDTVEQALVRAGADHDLGPQGYAAAYEVAADQLRLGLDVVADSVNPLPVTRQAWQSVADRTGARLLEVELTCTNPAEHRRRVEERDADIAGHVLPEWAGVTDRDYQPWAQAALRIDTAGLSVDDVVAIVDEALG